MTVKQTTACPPLVRCSQDGRIGRITLNRPTALNALNLEMIRSIDSALRGWETDPRIEVVVLDGAGERGFCAGGDIKVVHDAARDAPHIARTLWREEYQLDARIARYPRPVVALMDGIVMGGGLGLSAHADVRVVTERSVLAMPEVTIGLAPDVGGALLLARAPGDIGTHLALTAAHLGPEDAIFCGLADHCVHSSQLPALLDAMHHRDPANAAAAAAKTAAGFQAPQAPLAADQTWIDACYGTDSVEEIIAGLRNRPEAAARRAVAAISAAAPRALKVTLRALRAARTMTDLETCLVQDFRVSCRFLDHPDLTEGIRAAVIDKDHHPRWTPSSLVDVTPDMVAGHFLPLGEDEELRLPPNDSPMGVVVAGAGWQPA